MTSPLLTALLGGQRPAELLASLADAGPACQQADADLFFGPDDETLPERYRRENAAKAICRTCPARSECLAYAIETSPQHGVWAALSASELRTLRHRPTNAGMEVA